MLVPVLYALVNLTIPLLNPSRSIEQISILFNPQNSLSPGIESFVVRVLAGIAKS